MDFQLQQIHFCKTGGKGVYIKRVSTGINYIAYTINQC